MGEPLTLSAMHEAGEHIRLTPRSPSILVGSDMPTVGNANTKSEIFILAGGVAVRGKDAEAIPLRAEVKGVESGAYLALHPLSAAGQGVTS